MVPGLCPKPGRFKQRIPDFDVSKLAGVWIRVIDEIDFAKNYTCLSAQIEVVNATHVNFPQAEQFTESHREYRLSEDPDFDEDQEYLIDLSRKLEFTYKKDPTVAFIKSGGQ